MLFIISGLVLLLSDLEYFTINSWSLDAGGMASLLLLIAIILWLRLDEQIKRMTKARYKGLAINIIILFFIIAGIIGLWFTVRIFGLMVKQSLEWYGTNDSFNYLTSHIFLMLGFLLASNLCFSLATTFYDINIDKDRTNKTNGKSDRPKTIPRLLEVIIQAIIISLVTFIPRYADFTLIGAIGNGSYFYGAFMYVVILIALIGALIALIYFGKKEFQSEQENS